MSFKALLLEQTGDGVTSSITELDDDRLPDGEVTVEVEYSSLNYKDGMVLSGIGRLVREYPHVPGVDMAGVVSASNDERYAVGDRVVLTGWRVGEVWWGGYATRAKVKADWLVKLPDAISTQDAMAVGTAGFTAMLALIALQDHGLGLADPLLITGASGGLGSSAIVWAASAGYRVTASTGRTKNTDDLRSLGANDVIDRATIAAAPTRPLGSEQWGGCIDAVGGDTLANVLTTMKYGSSVAACGLAGGNSLNTTVIPFLLRGINLLGIDSVMCRSDHRERVWAAIEESGAIGRIAGLSTTVPLSEVAALASEILAGQVKGRIVVACQ